MIGDSKNVLTKGPAILKKQNPYPWTATRAEARILRRDVVLKVKKTGLSKERQDPHLRGKVSRFTFDSKRRLALVLRNTADLWEIMVTLTYPAEFSTDGKAVKHHLELFTKYLRRKGCAYLWVMEFQKRGAPHFHVLIKGKGNPGEVNYRAAWLPMDECKRVWFEIVNSGDQAHRDQGARIERITDGRMAGQYVAKMDQKTVPTKYCSPGRFWGCSRILEQVAFMTSGEWREVKQALLPMVADYTTTCAGWGFHWEWQGAGFTFVGGADVFREMLRQAVHADSGAPTWTEYEAEEKKPPFVSVADKLRLEAQLTLDGGAEPSYPYSEICGEFLPEE